MSLTPEEAENYLFDLHDLLDDVRDKLGLAVPSHGTRKDLDQLRTVMGTAELYELEIWIMICRGPVLLKTPLVGFGWENAGKDHFHYREILKGYPEWLAQKWVPIANDGCGNYYVFPLEGDFGGFRPVFSVYVGEDTTTLAEVVASHLFIFVKKLLEGELNSEVDALFDREHLAQSDPAALEVSYENDGGVLPGSRH